ncbi:MAG: hypothetical protein AAF581_09245, partial [Planctomycetota bacterium]
ECLGSGGYCNTSSGRNGCQERHISVCDVNGCADGDYFLTLNYAFALPTDPDPVIAMQSDFSSWRQSLIGRPDAVRSEVGVTQTPTGADLLVTLRDWQGTPLPGSASVTVTAALAPGAPGVAVLGAPVATGPATWTVPVQAVGTGIVSVIVTASDGIRPVPIMPSTNVPVSVTFRRADCSSDGQITIEDPILLLNSLFGGGAVVTCRSACDANDDGALDLVDATFALLSIFGLAAPIPAPSPGCGTETSVDGLDCAGHTGC